MGSAAIWRVVWLTFLVVSAAQPLPSTCPSTPTPQCNSHNSSVLSSSHGQQDPAAFGSEAVETTEQQQAIIAHLQALEAAAAAAGAVAADSAAEDADSQAHEAAAAAAHAMATDATVLPMDTWQSNAANSAANSNFLPGSAWMVEEDRDNPSSSSMWPHQVLPLEVEMSNTSTTTPTESPSIPYSGPRSQVERQLTYLGNQNIKVGVDLQRAGVISWVSSPLVPGAWKNKNLINTWDQGRLLQQSYYGCVDGSCWHTKPWLYNPVQGGSWRNEPSVTTHQQVDYGRIYVEGHPRNWGGGNLIQEITLTSDIKLKHNYVTAKFTVNYTGSATHPYMTQEVPAVFIDRRFSVLAYYAGSKPWTGDNNVTYTFPGAHNMYATPTERWAAFLHPESGWGLGVYNSKAWLGITAYRVGADRSPQPWDCSYFAHTIRMQLHSGMQPYAYTAYITVGTVSSIRATFARIAKLEEQAQGLADADEQLGAAGFQRGDGLQGADGIGSGAGWKSGGESGGTAAAAAPGPVAGQPDLGRNPFGRHAEYVELA